MKKFILMAILMFVTANAGAASLDCQVIRSEKAGQKTIVEGQSAEFIEAGGNQAVISKTVNDGIYQIYYFASATKSDSMVEIQAIGLPSKKSDFSYITRAKNFNEMGLNILEPRGEVYYYSISCRYTK